MEMTPLLERLTAPAPAEVRAKFVTPPWPEALAPKVVHVDRDRTGPLPTARAIICAWTAAEKQALADVLSPGKPYEEWTRYTENWSEFEKHLTGRSPAREERCLAQYQPVTIGGVPTLLIGINLHLATDDDTAPVIALWQQILDEVGPELVITHGTAGGIGASTQLGDVFVCGNAKFNCTQNFKAKPWAQQRFTSFDALAGPHAALFGDLVAGNASNLAPSGLISRAPTLTFGGDVETVDYFAFDDTDDSYGVVRDDPQAHSEEMDDACLFLAAAGRDAWSMIRLLSIRNASDPMVPSSVGNLEQQKRYAAGVYSKYGYTTTVLSSVAAALVVADL